MKDALDYFADTQVEKLMAAGLSFMMARAFMMGATGMAINDHITYMERVTECVDKFIACKPKGAHVVN